MSYYVTHPKEPVYYRDFFREYYIKCASLSHIIGMSFCPWCGSELPCDLRSEYFEVLENEFGLDLSLDDIRDYPDKIPPEFQTDEWWKKRGL